MAGNSEQVEYWNGAAGEKWARLQETMDGSLARITQSLMPFAAARPGESVLDVGCGCGSTTLTLSSLVSPGGPVVGLDISRPMLEVARARALSADLDVDFRETDAAVHSFDPLFDLIFSRFGVMFFDDPIAAFANIRNGVRPGGRLAFVCWRTAPENPWITAPVAASLDLLPPEEPMDPLEPGPFAFADNARIHQILSAAGFRDIRIEPLDSTMNLGATTDEAAAHSLNIGPLARRAAELNDATRDQIRARVRVALEEFSGPDGVTPSAACWLVGAKGRGA